MSENLRTKNAVRNGVVSLGGYIIVFVPGLLSRRFFLANLNIHNLGYEGLFTNLFIVIGAADMGAATLLVYRLYQSIAMQDDSMTKKYVAMAAKLYALSSTAMLLIGLAAMPLLKYLILDEVSDWSYAYLIYVIQLVGTAGVGYFSYHRLLFLANQRASDIAIIETVTRISILLVKILLILWTKNYILYVLATAAYSFIVNGIIALLSTRRFKTLYGGTCSMTDFRKADFWSELKGVWTIRLLGLIYYLTDTVLISATLGLQSVALYSNYVLIGSNVTGGIQSFLKPLSDSVGNYMHTNASEHSYRLYSTLNLLVFFISAIALSGFVSLFQPVVSWAFGQQYLLPMPFVILYALTLFLIIKNYSILAFRSGIGEYKNERIWAFLSSLANLAFSILGLKWWGIIGIQFGTLISGCVSHIGYYDVTFRGYFHMKPFKEIAISFLMMALAAVEAFLTHLASRALPVSLPGILVRMVLCAMIPTSINLLIFRKSESFAAASVYLQRALQILKKRLLNR